MLNGLVGRIDQKNAISVPIGIIPAGSDNSLVWTVLGVKDPIAAAITIVKVSLSLSLSVHTFCLTILSFSHQLILYSSMS